MAGSAPNVYRPSAFLRIQVRLEDFEKDQDPDNIPSEGKPFPDPAVKLNKELRSLNANLAELTAGGDSATNATEVAELRKKIATRRASLKHLQSSTPTASATAEGAGDVFSVDLYTVPIDLNVEMNSFRMADTMNATFPFIDAPLISDIIRAALVEVWIGTIPPEDFATADRWRLRRDAPGTTIVFRGYVDSWDTNHNDGDATIQIQARSYEAILIDAKINALARAYKITGANGAEKISTYVNRILGQLPASSGKQSGTSQLKAVWYGSPATVEPSLDRKSLLRSLQSAKSRVQANNGSPVVAAAADPGVTPGSSEGAAPGAPGMPPAAPGASGQETSVWDLITQACELAGCLPTYDPSLPPPRNAQGQIIGDAGNFLLLRPPQTIFEDVDEGYKIQGGAVDGFRRNFQVAVEGGTVGLDIPSEVRFMIWGKNIKNFKTSRKLGRVKVQGIEVRSYNPDAKPSERTLVARFPPAKIGSRLGEKGDGKTQEVLVRVVRGIRDPNMLKQIAVGLFHSLSRQELSVAIETDDMASYIDPSTGIAGNDAPDLLRLRPGSPCRVAVARQQTDPTAAGGVVISPLSEVFSARGEALAKMLLSQRNRIQPERSGFDVVGSPEQMAARITKALSAAKIKDVFYCRTITHKFTADEGWSATIELVNFATSRVDPDKLGPDSKVQNNARKTHPKVKSAAAKNQEQIAEATERAVKVDQGHK